MSRYKALAWQGKILLYPTESMIYIYGTRRDVFVAKKYYLPSANSGSVSVKKTLGNLR